MNRFFLTNDVGIELIARSEPFSDTTFIFGSRGSLAVAGKIITQPNATINTVISESIGSEHWFTEESDIVRFDNSGQLHTLILSLSEENSHFHAKLPQPQAGYFSIQLSPINEFFLLPPQIYRSFNSNSRELFCFTENAPPATVFRITSDLSLFFNNENMFSGWVLHRPLENLAATYQSEKDLESADDDTYTIFGEYFDIISNNEALVHDDDIEILVKNLLNRIDPQRIATIKGNVRREEFEMTVFDLKDNFLDT
ncbi:hypothetical protein [Massilia rubra]|uniref:Uncharacterized protein n=1 Tax=Massilia rubra TaxID=2607910 RepID=A0ABX0LJM2_9BURK|nr:hypothetical protein [Massilia rubra]NHZ32462.1 hypothetical protein [Massilia rubra]